MKSNQLLLMASLIFFFSPAQAWDYVDDSQGYVYGDTYVDDNGAYVSGDYYDEAPAGYAAQTVTPESANTFRTCRHRL